MASAELVIKKSRFIGWAVPVTTREDVLQWVEKARSEYQDARHHCWAYLLGSPETASSAAMNDDGEPSGTAGRPILNVIQHKKIGNVAVIVIRYFGGIKLGAGGLVRAYAGVTEEVLSALSLDEQKPLVSCTVKCDFAHEQNFRHFAKQHQVNIEGVQYSQQVNMQLQLEADLMEELTEFAAPLAGTEIELID